jgi:S1-C subfamily serine protease
MLGGDIVTAVQGHPVRSHEDYMARVSALKPGQRVRLNVVRDGVMREISLTVAERPRLPSDLSE